MPIEHDICFSALLPVPSRKEEKCFAQVRLGGTEWRRRCQNTKGIRLSESPSVIYNRISYINILLLHKGFLKRTAPIYRAVQDFVGGLYEQSYYVSGITSTLHGDPGGKCLYNTMRREYSRRHIVNQVYKKCERLSQTHLKQAFWETSVTATSTLD